MDEQEIWKAIVLTLHEDEQLQMAFTHLPWVDASGNAVSGGSPAASLESIIEMGLGSRQAAAQLGFDDYQDPFASPPFVLGQMRRLESLGYAQYAGEANGWNWPVACPSCQYLRLSGHYTPPRQDRPERLRDPIAPRRRFAILQRDGFRCTYCGRTAAAGAVLHVDHMVPVSAGGSDDDENLVTACDECNLGKGAAELP